MRDRARGHTGDIIIFGALLVGAAFIAPILVDAAASSEVDGMTGLLMGGLPFLLFAALVISFGVSAVRED